MTPKENDNKPEFDQYADSYKKFHKKSIGFSGENLDYFAKYKIEDVYKIALKKKRSGNISILDYGSGTGASVPYWNAFFPDANLVAADVSPESLNRLSAAFPKCKTLFLDSNVIAAPDNTFDIVFAACVFHHIDHADHIPILGEIRRVLKPGGFFIIFEHNTLNPLTLYAVSRCEFDINAKLVHFWRAKKIMRAAGLQKCATRFRVFFPGYLSFLRPLEKYTSWIPFGGQYYVCGTKI
ncbi:ubiquinone/menaquinone biosynthesis C-methylase UbiE [Ereboglobus sp. PH5-5]|uniref:class I SAM-dependent methyltransferase n=1 Tax=Ereboglobus sp. PH5-5 TaxID=2940529 RepID=UPI002405CCAE|nr:class I SAM-dependent methyltransferase [Ereboglobus sp. PH5-5]MDF9833994.1 ubiquinone/menaquinone biosynthesis C-methylase UbiE [Ereboglobus sp. PH5-5]